MKFFKSHILSFGIAIIVAMETIYLFRADMLASNIEPSIAMTRALQDSAWMLVPPVALLLIRDSRATTLVTCLYFIIAIPLARHAYLIASGMPARVVYPKTGAWIQLALLVASFAIIAVFSLAKLAKKLQFMLKRSGNDG